MGNSRKVWLACGASLGLPFAAAAQQLQHVEVTEEKDQVNIHVVGTSLPEPHKVTADQKDQLTFEWSAGMSGSGQNIPVDNRDVASVWYGWFSSHPRKVRVRVTTKQQVKTTVTKTDDGWNVSVNPVTSLTTASVTSLKQVSSKDSAAKLPAAQKIWVDPHAHFGSAMALVQEPHHINGGSSPVGTAGVRNAPYTIPGPKVTVVKATASRELDALVPPDPSTEFHKVSIDCSNADLTQVLKGLALQSGANIIIGPSITGKVTANLHNVSIEQALSYISFITGVKYSTMDGTYVFGSGTDKPVVRPISTEKRVARIVSIVSGEADRVKLAIRSTISQDLVQVYTPAEKVSQDTALQASLPGQGEQPDAGAALKPNTTASGDAKLATNYVLLVGTAAGVDEAERLARDIDGSIITARSENRHQDETEWRGGELFAYDVKFADPRALREAIVSQVPGIQATLAPNSVGAFGVFSEGKEKKQSKDVLTAESGVNAQDQSATSTASSNAISTSQVNDADLEQPFTKEEAIAVPMRLILRGDHEQIQLAVRYLQVLDTAPKQVALELRVMELTKEDALNAGIDWNILSGGAVKVINLNNSQSTANNIASLGISGNNFNADVTASLDALANKNNLIARPNLIAMDGRQSEIFVGDIVRYIQSITNSQNGISVTTGEVPVGVRLSVLPRIGADGNMTLDLRPRISILTSFTQVPGGGEIPQTSTRFAQSTISLQSGQTIAIGGLIQDQDTKNVSGIPFLMDLPLIGHLFKKTSNDKLRTEVVIFLTAKTIDGPVHADGTLPMEKDLTLKRGH